MTRTDVFKKLSNFLDPYLKYGIETLTLCLTDERLMVRTPKEMHKDDIIIRRFSASDLAVGLTSKSWQRLVDDVYLLTERFPECLD